MSTEFRDKVGRRVREVWVEWAKRQPDPKPSWLVPYDELNEADKEADRCIGAALWGDGVASVLNGDNAGTVTDFSVSEPEFKPTDKYLNPGSWHGGPIPGNRIGPYGLGQTCWYVTVEGGGWRRVFAAETAERAQEAAKRWMKEQAGGIKHEGCNYLGVEVDLLTGRGWFCNKCGQRKFSDD